MQDLHLLVAHEAAHGHVHGGVGAGHVEGRDLDGLHVLGGLAKVLVGAGGHELVVAGHGLDQGLGGDAEGLGALFEGVGLNGCLLYTSRCV